MAGFKLGLAVGFGAGYVLGSKAGREPYERLQRALDDFTRKPEIQRLARKVEDKVDEGINRAEEKLGHPEAAAPGAAGAPEEVDLTTMSAPGTAGVSTS